MIQFTESPSLIVIFFGLKAKLYMTTSYVLDPTISFGSGYRLSTVILLRLALLIPRPSSRMILKASAGRPKNALVPLCGKTNHACPLLSVCNKMRPRRETERFVAAEAPVQGKMTAAIMMMIEILFIHFD